mmetsp:Transcript_22865/g.72572  ORF Transcript_22865/g.72572 Transcript_22865/m.72572 type:complete len:82 (+) Transcript_22865:20-265(+)|eukprot:CAMPEP_0185309720 /NCGR_PEP_ID=MMETSP1363-20130426/22586_1 /TAXON_ID=38817 /ORGANISM="Gephyrocapsa oceanica, Strain RCC1303" /LENGTH=81 /DNA_ID=CAMNT_0027907229 /DNA_START=15 /DNA_END=260 /DNA_ORIENTATION=-
MKAAFMLLALGGSADALLVVPRASPRMAATTDWSSDEPWHATSTASSTPSKAAFEQAFAPVAAILEEKAAETAEKAKKKKK